jgi:hypothetical protein
LRVVQINKPVLRGALTSEAAVEGLVEQIIGRLAGPAEVQLRLVPLSPVIQRPCGEPRPVVHGDHLRHASVRG